MNWKRLLKYASLALCIGLAGGVYYEYESATHLIRFRTTDQVISLSGVKNPPSMLGFADLHISGSCRPTQYGLEKAFQDIKMPIYIFDLMGEDHYYIKGMPERWYGYHYNVDKLHHKETRSLRKFLHEVLFTGKFSHDVSELQSEKEMIENLGYHYISIEHTRKATLLEDQVDHLIATFKSLPHPVWIHFHCSAGRGRTTIAMVMYDILKNGRMVSLEDIVQRHRLLGSEDLFDTTVWSNGHYSKEMLEERKQLIVDFYAYVNDPMGLDTTTWSAWQAQRAKAQQGLAKE